jgi:hypothetical protein
MCGNLQRNLGNYKPIAVSRIDNLAYRQYAQALQSIAILELSFFKKGRLTFTVKNNGLSVSSSRSRQHIYSPSAGLD